MRGSFRTADLQKRAERERKKGKKLLLNPANGKA